MQNKFPQFNQMLQELLAKKCIHVKRDEVLRFHQFASYVVNVYAGALTDNGQYLYIE